MKRIITMALALLAVLALSAAEGGCQAEEGDQHPSAPRAPDLRDRAPNADDAKGAQPNPREADPEPHPQRVVTIRTGVPEANVRPYVVIIVAPGADRPFIDEIVTGPEYNTRVLVPKSSAVSITVEVKPARNGSKQGFCAIESGNQHDGPRFIAGAWRANCFLTLKPQR